VRQRFGETAVPRQHGTQIVVDVGLARVGRQDQAIQPLGFLQAACPMKLHGLL
jgi:hypothetical protein